MLQRYDDRFDLILDGRWAPSLVASAGVLFKLVILADRGRGIDVVYTRPDALLDGSVVRFATSPRTTGILSIPS